MTVELPVYWKDPYLESIETTVLKVDENDVILKDDIFYPESGGQESDEGYLLVGTEKVAEVIHVRKENGKSILEVKWLSQVPEEKSKVTAMIDIEKRKALMRAHTAQHLVSALLKQNNLDTIRAEIHPDEFIIETDKPLTPEILNEVLSKSNMAILNGLKVTAYYYSREEAGNKDLGTRKPLKKAGEIVRIIEIENIDRTFCGGTHVTTLSEIGMLQLPSFGKKFVHVFTGKKTLETLGKETKLKIDLSKELTTSPEQVFETLQLLYQKMRKELSEKDKASLGLLKFILSNKEAFMLELFSSKVLVLPSLPFTKKQLNKVIRILKENKVENYVIVSMDGFLNIDLSHVENIEKVEKLYQTIISEFKCKGGGKKGKYTLKLPTTDFDYQKFLELARDV